MRISEMARLAGVGVETVRYYERTGLLPSPSRTHGRYRSYDDDDLARLRFIRRAKKLGFQLDEVAQLLALRQDESTSCAEVARRAHEKVADLERRMTEMGSIRRALLSLAESCNAGTAPGACALLTHLADEDPRHG